ncbi:hypothetical protein H0E87_027434 [Populus deltoides]|uniref:FAR1 domain-containing protein n=1 Tax=Populus deltoides TaxID=3696 RepID=A0A8T2WYN5_POPDE|nr:hypothetical protein H0E87_027434 [Populus deltoides]
MEIDLELPSSDQEKLESGANTNECIMDSASELRGINEAASSCLVEEVIEACGLNAIEGVIDGGDKVEERGVGVDGVGEGGISVPQNGLKFETKEAAYAFYRDYALSVGFGITIKASRRSKKNGKFIDVKIACSRFGSKRESSVTVNPRSCTKTDCKAGMHMKRTEDEKWVIYSFVKEHNHEICKEDYDNATGRRNKQSGAVARPKKAIKLGKEGSLSKEAYDIAVRTLEEVLENCVGLNNSVKSVLEPNTLDVLGFPGFEEENCDNCLAKSSKKKRTCKKKKVYSEAGGIKIGLQESYQQMDQINSRAHHTENCYIPQQDTQEELGSRAPNLEGYYGSQEGAPGVGQLNSISPFRDAYYSNQQGLPVLGQLHLIPTHVSHYGAPLSMQGLGQLGFRAPTMQTSFSNLPDLEQPVSSTQFNGIASKHLHDKHLSS